MAEHSLQEGLGQTGHFGEFFVGLGALIAVGGITMIALAYTGAGPWEPGTSNAGDASTSGFLYLFLGVGFVMFGVMALLSGWGRHHPEFDEP